MGACGLDLVKQGLRVFGGFPNRLGGGGAAGGGQVACRFQQAIARLEDVFDGIGCGEHLLPFEVEDDGFFFAEGVKVGGCGFGEVAVKDEEFVVRFARLAVFFVEGVHLPFGAHACLQVACVLRVVVRNFVPEGCGVVLNAGREAVVDFHQGVRPWLSRRQGAGVVQFGGVVGGLGEDLLDLGKIAQRAGEAAGDCSQMVEHKDAGEGADAVLVTELAVARFEVGIEILRVGDVDFHKDKPLFCPCFKGGGI